MNKDFMIKRKGSPVKPQRKKLPIGEDISPKIEKAQQSPKYFIKNSNINLAAGLRKTNSSSFSNLRLFKARKTPERSLKGSPNSSSLARIISNPELDAQDPIYRPEQEEKSQPTSKMAMLRSYERPEKNLQLPNIAGEKSNQASSQTLSTKNTNTASMGFLGRPIIKKTGSMRTDSSKKAIIPFKKPNIQFETILSPIPSKQIKHSATLSPTKFER